MDAKDTIMGVVYIAINKINNKVYVGQSFNFKKRKRQHITSALNGLDYPFYKAIRKYGKENFEWRIICECSEQSLLNKAEQVFIDYYGGINSKKNYNAKDGGYRGTLCEESRKKIGNSNKGKKRTIEVKNKLSEMRRGRILNKDISGDKNPMFGKHHSDETKQKIRKALKGKYVGDKSAMFGKQRSEETKKKLSNANKGIPRHTEESKKKISEKNRGRMPVNYIEVKLEDIIEQLKLSPNIFRKKLAENLNIGETTLLRKFNLVGCKNFTEFKRKFLS